MTISCEFSIEQKKKRENYLRGKNGLMKKKNLILAKTSLFLSFTHLHTHTPRIKIHSQRPDKYNPREEFPRGSSGKREKKTHTHTEAKSEGIERC